MLSILLGVLGVWLFAAVVATALWALLKPR